MLTDVIKQRHVSEKEITRTWKSSHILIDHTTYKKVKMLLIL